MKKRMLSLALSLFLAVSLFVPAFAAGAEPVTPTAPEWIDEEDYLTFAGDMLYSPENEAEENWEKILSLRTEAEQGAKTVDAPTFQWSVGQGTAAYRYEVGLIWLKCAENAGLTTYAGQKALRAAARAFGAAASSWQNVYVEEPDEMYCRLGLYEARAYLLRDETYEDYVLGMVAVMIDRAITKLGMTMDDIYDAPHMELVTPVKRYLVENELNDYYFRHDRPVLPSAEGYIQIFLDDIYVPLDVPAALANGRTMIPIRAVAEALGADVGWDNATRQVTLTRAGTTVVMTVDSPTATVNGEAITMDVAPYISGGRTLIPVRYVAEFFGQKVEWNGKTRRVLISEDKTAAGESNLEAWALPMGAMLGMVNGDQSPLLFGAYGRTADAVESCRKNLSSGWSISSREELVSTVIRMTFYGHDTTFRSMAADVKQRPEAERKAISEASDAWPYFMWAYTEALDEKWGDRGIMAWDLFRMSSLAQWGYTAGYVTYEEALVLLEPAATLLCENFSSWDEAYENYLDGYTWWARTSAEEWANTRVRLYDQNIITYGDRIKEYETQEGWQSWMTVPRGTYYFEMKTSPKVSHIFDDALFDTGVIGFPAE